MELITESRASLETFRASDSDKYGLIEKLLKQVESMAKEKTEIEDRLQDTEYTRAHYRQDLESSKRELAELKALMSRNAFVLVLVDGDASPFKNELIQNGTSGGDSVARNLRTNVAQHIAEKTDVSPDCALLIRVYSKMQGLNKKYQDVGILDNTNKFQEFVQGFNRFHPLCEYVDAGNDKEGADTKIKDTMTLFADNVHCKHIVLCASSDNSYTGFLRKFVPEGQTSKRITLAETIPFPPDLAELSQNFVYAAFDEVFRSSRIPKRRVSFRGVTVSPMIESPVTSYASQASKTINGNSQSLRSVESSHTLVGGFTTGTNGAIETTDNLTIRVNANGQRIEARMLKPREDLISKLMSRKLCNRHFLSCCTYKDDCTHDHKGNLDPAEQAALRWIARKTVCKKGSSCRDRYCVAAHMCVYGENCDDLEGCRYPKEMHGVSTDGARDVPAWS